jgi:hypothetical protein
MFSPTANTLGDFMREHTAETDAVLTNLKPAEPPFKASDITGGKATTVVADRFVLWGINSMQQMEAVPSWFKGASPPLLFIVARSRPLSPELITRIKEQAVLRETVVVKMPPNEESVADKVRSFVWYRVFKKGKMGEIRPGASVKEETFDVYRFK